MKTTTLLAGLALATLALAAPTASADIDIRTPFGEPCDSELVDCGPADTENPCNGIYDDHCKCPTPTFFCNPGDYCEQYIVGLCVIGYLIETHLPTE